MKLSEALIEIADGIRASADDHVRDISNPHNAAAAMALYATATAMYRTAAKAKREGD